MIVYSEKGMSKSSNVRNLVHITNIQVSYEGLVWFFLILVHSTTMSQYLVDCSLADKG